MLKDALSVRNDLPSGGSCLEQRVVSPNHQLRKSGRCCEGVRCSSRIERRRLAHPLRLYQLLRGAMPISIRSLAWTLGFIAVVLVIVPLMGMIGMMGMGGTIMGGKMDRMTNGMIGMPGVGLVWMLLALIIVVALVVALIRAASKT
jgi:hypothetical protein